MNAINRRSFVAGAAFGISGTVVAAPIAKTAGAVSPDLAEVTAIYRDLNAERRARILGNLRDCLAAQRFLERDEAGRASS